MREQDTQPISSRPSAGAADPHTTLYAHNGMAQSARALLPGVLTAIREGSSRRNGRYKNYEIIVTGHSLGAGTACLLSLLLSSQHNLPVTTYAFAPPPVVNNFPLPPSILDKCKIHSFINNQDAVPRASHSEILNLLSILNAIDSMAWKAVDRTLLLMRGYLTNEERQLMKESIDNKSQHRINFHGENDEIDMIVPGDIYLLKPKRDASISHLGLPSSQQVSASPHSPKEERGEGGGGEGGGGDAKKNSLSRYEICSIPATESMSLYNGFFYTGDTMVSDHLVSSYLTSMINLQTNGGE